MPFLLLIFLVWGCSEYRTPVSHNDVEMPVRVLAELPADAATITLRQYGQPEVLTVGYGERLIIPRSFDTAAPMEVILNSGHADLRALVQGPEAVLSAETTAAFAGLDSNNDGTIDPAEQLRNHDAEQETAIAAALDIFLVERKIRGTEAQDSYQLALLLSRHPETLTLIRLLSARQEEVLFLPLDARGRLVEDGGTCVDDLRATAAVNRSRGYGFHVWHDPKAEAAPLLMDRLTRTLETFNRQKFCGTEGWSLPTLAEIQAFPQLTPGLYWIQGEQPVVYDSSTQALAPDAKEARSIYKSWVKVSGEGLKIPMKQTPEEIKTIIAPLRLLYKERISWPAPQVDPGTEWTELGPLPDVVFPQQNAYSDAKMRVGKRLFFDTRLSQNRDISCASCHIPSQGWDDNLPTAIGHAGLVGKRNTPSLLNVGLVAQPFWDGRAHSLEEQALGPIVNPREMNLPLSELQKRIDAAEFNDYQQDLIEAFGDAKLSSDRIAQAMATFERTIKSGSKSRFDEFLAGQKTLTDDELWGLDLFRGKARCMNCHSGPNFTNNTFENIGLANYGQEAQDFGRYAITRKPEDLGKFRVPSLRDLQQTAPYMHTGRFPLPEVLTAYNAAMGVRTVPTKLKIGARRYDPLFQEGSSRLRVLNLTEPELKALEAFLGTL